MTAVVATVSLNPSWREFQSPAGTWLRGRQRRLASMISLGVRDPGDLHDEHLAQVVAESNGYFRGPGWNRQWFGWLESVLRESGAGSYLDGSACHLDLVQWATKPIQRDLPCTAWQQLVDADREFFSWQLAHSNVTVVLLNGASVMHGLQRAGLVSDWATERLEYQARAGVDQLHMFQACSAGVVLLGWNRPVAGPLPAAGRSQLARWIARALQSTTAAGQLSGVPDPARAPAGLAAYGLIPPGTAVDSVEDLERLLAGWLQCSTQPTIGEVGTFGGTPLIAVRSRAEDFVLNRDTKRSAVAAFLAAAKAVGGAANLPWHAAPNARGVINRISYRPDDMPTPGWYAYVRVPQFGGS